MKTPKRTWLRGVAVAVAGALLTGAVSYAFGVLNDIRKSKLDFASAQIEKLYGPLYALTTASKAGHDISYPFATDDAPPTVEAVVAWRHWVLAVGHALDVRMEDIIVTNSQLIVGDKMPKAFIDFIGRAERFKTIIAGWKDSDLDGQGCTQQPVTVATCPALRWEVNVPSRSAPTNIDECVAKEFVELKRRQEELEGMGSILALMFIAKPRELPDCDQ